MDGKMPAHRGIVYEEFGLESVDERQPCQISKRQHESKSITCDIHRCQNGWFIVKCIEDVDKLKNVYQHH